MSDDTTYFKSFLYSWDLYWISVTIGGKKRYSEKLTQLSRKFHNEPELSWEKKNN